MKMIAVCMGILAVSMTTLKTQAHLGHNESEDLPQGGTGGGGGHDDDWNDLALQFTVMRSNGERGVTLATGWTWFNWNGRFDLNYRVPSGDGFPGKWAALAVTRGADQEGEEEGGGGALSMKSEFPMAPATAIRFWFFSDEPYTTEVRYLNLYTCTHVLCVYGYGRVIDMASM